MRYLSWILLGLLGLECLSIILVTDWIGGGWTLLLILISFISGIMMLRHIGFSAVLLAGAGLRSRQNMSLYQLLWPIRYMISALMLMSPGFFSDIIALILLLPIAGTHKPASTAQDSRNSDIIEGEYTVQSNHPKQPDSTTTPRLPE
ncbi:FxsA family protein [Neisseriaceae bacterium ESL0693]|nr:FxsA family protein [Neisseriaceae bacterium ESL0693]